MTIHNGTKSERTSFALYGTLSNGASITFGGKTYTGNVFICVGPITVKSDQTLPGETAPGNQTFAVGSITFTCGQDLTLTNNYLAWTDASGTTGDRCTTFSNATTCADIAPKCGTAASITIKGPVFAPVLAKTDPTCTVSTGCVTITSSTTGLTFSIDSKPYTAYPTGGWCNLASGQHCVTSKRTSDGCVSPQSCITIGTAPAPPVAPTLSKVDPTCTVSTGCVTVTSATTGYTFSLDGGDFTAYPSGGWCSLASGQHCVRSKNSDGCISDQACITIAAAPAPAVAPTLSKVDPTCTVSTGKVTVTSTTTGYTFSLDGGDFTAYPSGGWTVSSGQHCVRSKNSDGCISDPVCVTIATQPATPQQPTVTITDASLCGNATATVTVTCPIGTGYQYSNNGGAWQTSPTFSGLAAGSGFSITVKNSDGCVSAATTCQNYTSVTCNNPTTTQKAVTNLPVISEATTVTAAPNPFNDHIKFTITPGTSGRGTLDLYNLLGQKVKTVFQGQVQKGQTQTIEYSVPNSQRNMLLYQFNVGKERLSGKLLGLK